MNEDFSDVMSQRSDKQLAEILTVKRDFYKPEAIESAEREFNKRNLNISDFYSAENLNAANDPVAAEDEKLSWTYKILALAFPGIVTRLIVFITAKNPELLFLKMAIIPLCIIVQVLIYRSLRSAEKTRQSLDFRLWTINGYLLYIALFVLTAILAAVFAAV